MDTSYRVKLHPDARSELKVDEKSELVTVIVIARKGGFEAYWLAAWRAGEEEQEVRLSWNPDSPSYVVSSGEPSPISLAFSSASEAMAASCTPTPVRSQTVI